MTGNTNDLLWPHFMPLWQDLLAASTTDILVAGGYGLFLKQLWLACGDGPATVVPMQNWMDATPRVTKDVDLVLGLDIVGNESTQQSVIGALRRNNFEVSDQPPEQRWKFLKRLEDNQKIIVELHSPRPLAGTTNIKATEKRVSISRRWAVGAFTAKRTRKRSDRTYTLSFFHSAK